VTEMTLMSLFAPFGEVMGVSLPPESTHPLSPNRRGYGFVHFSGKARDAVLFV
jgi:RNA recognition motif-containing protein